MNDSKYRESLVFSIKAFIKKELDFDCTLEIGKYVLEQLYLKAMDYRYELNNAKREIDDLKKLLDENKQVCNELKKSNELLRQLNHVQ